MAIPTTPKVSDAVDQSVAKDQINYLNSMHDAPAVRLDAEFYQADDIDGAADGLSGSGNLNYLVLQSQQTNDAGMLNNPFNVMDGDNIFGEDALGGGPSAGDAVNPDFGGLHDEDSGMALAGNPDNGLNITGTGSSSDFPSMGTGMGAAGAALKAKGINIGGDSNKSIEITNIENPPPEPPPPADDVDLTVDIDTPILDIDLDTILDPIEDIVGDIDIDIDAIVDNLLPGDHGLLPDIDASVDALLGGTTILNTSLGEILAPLDPVISGATDLLDGVIDGVEGLLPDALTQPITDIINTVLNLTGLNGGSSDTDLLLNLGAIIPGFTTLNTALNIPLDPVELLLGDIDITADADALVNDLGGHLFSVIGDLQDGDVAGILDTVIGADGILQNLGGVTPEAVLGLDVVTDLLPDLSEQISTENLLGDVTDIVGDVLGGDLLDGDALGSDVLNGVLDGILGGGGSTPGGDTDLTLDTGLNVLGIEVPDINLDIPLDPVEELVGDIDIGVDVSSITDGTLVQDALGALSEGDVGGVLDEVTTSLGLDTHLDLLPDADTALGVGTDTVSDILDNILGGGSPQQPGDTDLTIDTGINVLGIEIPDINLDIPLDIAESLVGDIDIDLDVASMTDFEDVTSILDDIGSGDIGGLLDDIGSPVGIDTHLDLLGDNDIGIDLLPGDLGDILSGGTGGITEGLGDAVGSLMGGSPVPDVLPDPVGTITGGLGSVIDTTPVLGGLGGLLGGGGGGGLFG